VFESKAHSVSAMVSAMLKKPHMSQSQEGQLSAPASLSVVLPQCVGMLRDQTRE